MFLRVHSRIKDGKPHRYFSVVESVRSAGARHPYQKTLLYLGEINAEQEAAWIKSIAAFDPQSGQTTNLCLFPDDRPLPADLPAPALPIKLSDYTLSRPRQFGACWLASELWRTLKLDEFWSGKLGRSREGTDWAALLQVSVAYRLISPGSEWKLHRHWYDQSAMGDLLGGSFHWGGKDQLYEVLDQLLVHRDELFTHLKARWEDLFGVKYQVLLYDLTSTYFEGEADLIPKAKRGYSRDHRPDCQQIVIALIVTPEGFPLTYETLDGNTLDKQTLPDFIARIEAKYGSAERVWIMDRGIPTEDQLIEIRKVHPTVKYLVGTPRTHVRTKREQWESLPWEKVRDTVEVKRFEENGELYVVAKSGGRYEKERAMRRRRLVQLLRALRQMRAETDRDRLLQRVGVARSKAGRAKSLVSVELPPEGQKPERANFRFKLDKKKLKEMELYDGHYLLRSNLITSDPKATWQMYMLLVEIEAVFRNFKNDLGIRPVFHQLGPRVDAHIFVCFLAYCSHVTLKQWLRKLAPGLTPRQALDQLATVQMIDLEFPTTDGRQLVLSRYTQPETAVKLLLAGLGKSLPEQSPPQIRGKKLV